MAPPKQPRGIRNHNPGNIERNAIKWKGMKDDQSSDPRFIVFSAPVWGLRALARLLRNYYNRGQRSVASILLTYAPAVENDTNAYIAAVASALGVAANETIELDQDMKLGLMRAIVKHENGQDPYPEDLYREAIRLENPA